MANWIITTDLEFDIAFTADDFKLACIASTMAGDRFWKLTSADDIETFMPMFQSDEDRDNWYMETFGGEFASVLHSTDARKLGEALKSCCTITPETREAIPPEDAKPQKENTLDPEIAAAFSPDLTPVDSGYPEPVNEMINRGIAILKVLDNQNSNT